MVVLWMTVHLHRTQKNCLVLNKNIH
uniref:Uncharacterized protein n=1 Tax=Anguilla anguilla TaxID=7936 RepID=A0A0E9TA62_ANGAN